MKYCIFLALLIPVQSIRAQPMEAGYERRKFPGPLYSIGQSIVAKDTFAPILTYDFQQFLNETINTLSFSVLYGITDNFSVTLTLPVTLKHRLFDKKAVGLADFNAIFEYAILNKVHDKSDELLTVLFGVFFPTSHFKNVQPTTGTGTYSLFFGWTASHWSDPWYAFGSGGVQIPLKHRTTKLGDIFFYEWGFGRNFYRREHMNISILFEMDGIYTKHVTVDHVVNRNTGNNVIFAGPTLRWNYYNFLLQAAVQYPLAQSLFGIQTNRYDYRCSLALIWSF